MAPSDDRNRARRGRPARKGGGTHKATPGKGRTRGGGRSDTRGAPMRDSAMEGGFGPWGKPRPPERERRPDQPGRARDRDDQASRLRVRGERRPAAAGATRSERTGKAGARAPRRRRRPPGDVETEVLRLGGTRGPYLLDRLMSAADAFGHDRDREALTLLRPVRDALPDAPSVRELSGLAQYRLGNYRAAAKELEAYVELTDAVDQHPVLMDCYRAQRRWRKVDDLWADLGAASPSSELVTEGRIVAAGALADRGRLDEAIEVLDRKSGDVKRARPHHLRLWYALGDLEERAGNLGRARVLFDRVRAHDPEFADVVTRRAALA